VANSFLFVSCPFCHRSVFRPLAWLHRARHMKPLADGQMTDHITVPPSQRFEGSLEGVPQTYFHAKCGVSTGMPEEIVRSYLVNPFLYSGFTFCCGCQGYVSHEELSWIETGENLAKYFAKLKDNHLLGPGVRR